MWYLGVLFSACTSILRRLLSDFDCVHCIECCDNSIHTMASVDETNWVQCDRCDDWVLFDNTGLTGQYDEKCLKELKYVCRMCKIEYKLEEHMKTLQNTVNGLIERVGIVESRLNEVESRQTVSKIELEGKVQEVKNLSLECESKVVVSNNKCEVSIGKLTASVSELEDKITAVGLKVDDLREEFPTPNEWVTVQEKKRARMTRSSVEGVEGKKGEKMTRSSVEGVEGKKGEMKKVSFAEEFKDYGEETVMVIGDSLTRWVGSNLSHESQMFSNITCPGARVEDITKKVEKLGEKARTHAVLMVGTNNLKRDGTEVLMMKYEKLAEVCGKASFRKVTFVGIPSRYDLSNFDECRRQYVNRRLEKMCMEKGLGYIKAEFGQSRIGRDRLHLSRLGSDEVSRTIFKHCVAFLA